MSEPCIFCRGQVPAFLKQKSEGVCSKRCGRAFTAVIILNPPGNPYNITDGVGPLRSIERSRLPE